MGGTVITVLEDDADTIGGLCNLVHNALLEKAEAVDSGGFSGKQYKDGTTRFVVLCIEEVTQIERRVRVRFISGFILEKVEGHGEVVALVQCLRVGITLRERTGGPTGYDFFLLLRGE